MAKNDNPKPKPEAAGKRYPSRDQTKYVALPLDVWTKLKALADADDRSVSWMAKRAVLEYIEQHAPPADAK